MNLLLSLVTGVLLVLIFPRFEWTWLAPVALTPLLIASARERAARPFARRARLTPRRSWCVITDSDGFENWHVHQFGWLSGA